MSKENFNITLSFRFKPETSITFHSLIPLPIVKNVVLRRAQIQRSCNIADWEQWIESSKMKRMITCNRNNVRRLAHNAQSRWQALLEKKDHKAIWASINWKGKVEFYDGDRNKPDDKVFCRHFEKLLNPVLNSAEITVPHTAMYVRPDSGRSNNCERNQRSYIKITPRQSSRYRWNTAWHSQIA